MIPNSVYIFLAFNSYRGTKDVTQLSVSRQSAWNLDLAQKVVHCPSLTCQHWIRGDLFDMLIKFYDQVTTNILKRVHSIPEASLWNFLAITSDQFLHHSPLTFRWKPCTVKSGQNHLFNKHCFVLCKWYRQLQLGKIWNQKYIIWEQVPLFKSVKFWNVEVK